jgi:hypothetical protein
MLNCKMLNFQLPGNRFMCLSRCGRLGFDRRALCDLEDNVWLFPGFMVTLLVPMLAFLVLLMVALLVSMVALLVGMMVAFFVRMMFVFLF